MHKQLNITDQEHSAHIIVLFIVFYPNGKLYIFAGLYGTASVSFGAMSAYSALKTFSVP
jgi:hypothetical protein